MSHCFRILLIFVVAVAISCVSESSSSAQNWVSQAKKIGGKISGSVKTEAGNFSNSVSKIAPNGISTGKISPFSSSKNYSHLGRTTSTPTNRYTPIGINPYPGANSNRRPGVTHNSFADLQRDLKLQQQITAEKQRQASINRNQETAQLIGQGIQAIGQAAQRNQLRREREQFEQQRSMFQQQLIQNQNQGYQSQGFSQPNYQQQVQPQYQQPQMAQQQVRRPVFRQSQPAMAHQQGMVQQGGRVVYQNNGHMQPQMVQQGGQVVQHGFSQSQPIQQGAPVYRPQMQQPVRIFGRR